MRCRQGDTAIIIRSDWKENIGAIVTVIKPYGFVKDNFVWYIERQDGALIKGIDTEYGDISQSTLGVASDSSLQPLRGITKEGNENESIRDKQTANA